MAHAAAMLHSLLAQEAHAGTRIHLLHGPDLSSRARRRLAAMVAEQGGEISFVSVPDEWCRGLPTRGFTGKATWYRIFVPELLPDHERALFLDADLIVVDSLVPLWRTDLSGSYLAAVTNVFPRQFANRPRELGLAGEGDYFNAGVLLLNLELMRREDCTRALHRYATGHASELVWRDQDALNAVLAGRRRRLEPRWNCMNSILLFPESVEIFGAAAVEEARRNPAVRHFEGPGDNKPWHRGCERAMRELYIEHRRQTPWPRVRLEGTRTQRALAPLEARARRIARRVLSA